MPVSTDLPTMEDLIHRKKQKHWLTEGTNLFNQKPKKGIEMLCAKGSLKNPPDPKDIAHWLRENPRLDKTKIAEYICK